MVFYLALLNTVQCDCNLPSNYMVWRWLSPCGGGRGVLLNMQIKNYRLTRRLVVRYLTISPPTLTSLERVGGTRIYCDKVTLLFSLIMIVIVKKPTGQKWNKNLFSVNTSIMNPSRLGHRQEAGNCWSRVRIGVSEEKQSTPKKDLGTVISKCQMTQIIQNLFHSVESKRVDSQQVK